MKNAELRLGIEGFSYEDLFVPEGLARLHTCWLADLRSHDPNAHQAYERALQEGGSGFATPQEHAAWLLTMAPHVSRFVAQLFGPYTQAAVEALRQETLRLRERFVFQDRFVKRFVNRRPVPSSSAELEAQARILLQQWGCGQPTEEASVATAVLALLNEEQRLSQDALQQTAWQETRSHVETISDWVALHRETLAPHWPSLHSPQALDYDHLVPLERLTQPTVEVVKTPSPHKHGRDGFDCTDPGGTRLEVQAEVAYCLYCHERDKDSCRKGLRDKQGQVKTNPLGVALQGCPLDENISEMHVLHREGDPIAALAVVCVDNPLCPGTGHRICNDCMKACIYQKQEPVNIPQVETGVLTDVLNLPWGVEIYGLLTRWNPLNLARPTPLPFNGYHVLVVGLGPAGYTLAHHLAREGFGVVGIDGLKLTPPPQPWTGDPLHDCPPTPVFAWNAVTQPLSTRPIAGFGGVSEYGITVRWNKNFLTLLYLTLARNPHIRFYGGVRFGGTVTLEDAWALGFSHVALATGAGAPTLLDLPHNLARGMRQASDFLMTLQLGGAFQKNSLTNLQVRLPALVIGGGLTATDTATELLAYYKVQVEKAWDQWQRLTQHLDGRTNPARANDLYAQLSPDEQQTLEEWLAHAQLLHAERERARLEQREPQFQKLLAAWGGVTVVYRKRLVDSPAYRLNHEEVAKSLEEGIFYAECLAPLSVEVDEAGACQAMVFAKQTLQEGRWVRSAEQIRMPARTLCIAVGTQPNTTYEVEHPGHFLQGKDGYFMPHEAQRATDGTVALLPNPHGFFTSYHAQEHTVSFYGDSHPVYAGSVVKAMASAKHGAKQVAQLYAPSMLSGTHGEAESSAAPLSFRALCHNLKERWNATVRRVQRLTPNAVEIQIHAPAATSAFQPGQFYRLQNLGTPAMESLALTGAEHNPEQGWLSLVALELGSSSALCQSLQPGEPVVLMGPTGTPTELPHGELVCLVGGGLGNAVLLSIAHALRRNQCQVLYIAGYKRTEDRFKHDLIETGSDQVVWACENDPGSAWSKREQDLIFTGNVVQALQAYAEGRLPSTLFSLQKVRRFIVIGSDRMMNAVRQARHTTLQPYLSPRHVAIGSINSPMQCMMKGICAQCLQRQVDPLTGEERFVFSCENQDQPLDAVDFEFLHQRLAQNSLLEKLSRWSTEHNVSS